MDSLEQVELQISHHRQKMEHDEDRFAEKHREILLRQECLNDTLRQVLDLLANQSELTQHLTVPDDAEVRFYRRLYLSDLDQLTLEAYQSFYHYRNELDEKLAVLERNYSTQRANDEQYLYGLYNKRSLLEKSLYSYKQ